jgi:hypothetical protein
MKQLKAPRPPLSEDEIFERSLLMVDALESLLERGEITPRQYVDAVIELAKWGQSKRALLES